MDQSSPRSQLVAPNMRDDGSHSPPSVMIGPQFGWNDLAQKTTALFPTQSGGFSSGSMKLSPPCGGHYNHFSKRAAHFKPQTIYGQKSDHCYPLLNEDFEASLHFTEEGSVDGRRYNQTRSQSPPNQPSQEGVHLSQVDLELSVR